MGEHVTRRDLIRLAGTTAVTAAFAGAGLGTTHPARAVQPLALPASRAFDLADPSDPVFMHRPTWCPTVMQCAGYDHLNKHWYVAQVMYNPDDGVPYATRLKEGDIAITKLSADGATKIGRMYLRGFGHGAQIGVEPTAAGAPPYLWIEYASEAPDGRTGFGTKVCRVKYLGPPASQPPRSFHWDSAADRAAMDFKDRTPDPAKLPGAGATLSAPRPVVDIHHRRLLVRFNRGGGLQCAVWDLDAAVAAPLGAPLAHRADLYKPPVAQGFCLYGSYLYMYEGEAYKNGGPGNADDTGNTYITRVDLNTGVTERALTRALKSLTFREPEGMNVMLVPDAAGPGGYRARLTFGFASGAEGARRCNIAYKDKLV
ncbi:hypothetical protein [Streptomyces lasiicapitis]|uniref:Uncharacterized protein n=1 Tax=Streptomyces lasiicapitis TaxID=1923961 RepID=A0ABQ2LMM5_9ACTN|nr:hypothetical protein [Streptomyces lasiicapitis]GGO40402.1 hypothetical protein GCM10012286_18370 [Streptomyces lasiicapitis]